MIFLFQMAMMRKIIKSAAAAKATQPKDNVKVIQTWQLYGVVTSIPTVVSMTVARVVTRVME